MLDSSTTSKTIPTKNTTWPDLKVLGDLAERTASAVRTIPGTVSAYAERTFGGRSRQSALSALNM